MKIKKNGKIVNLTESDLRRIVKRTLTEGEILVDGTDLKSGYGKIKEGLLTIVDIVAQSGEGMGRIESEVRNDINSAFSSLNFDKLIKLFTELGNEQFLKSFTNAIEFEEQYKEYIIDKLGTLMKDMTNSVKSQKEKMASEGGEQKTEKIKENLIVLSPCRSLTGESGAECIMSQMVSGTDDFIYWLNDYEKMMGKTNKSQLKNESLKKEVNKIKHLFNFKKGDVITESLLNEAPGDGCECPDGTTKPECCNTPAQKHARAMKNVKSKDYFQKNPKGTITMDSSNTFPSIIMINGSKDGVDKTGDVPSFDELWDFNGGGRGFRTGSTGKFNYTYDNGEILITPASGNEGQSHGQRAGECGCSYEVDERAYGKFEKLKGM